MVLAEENQILEGCAIFRCPMNVVPGGAPLLSLDVAYIAQDGLRRLDNQ
jgi:hypothetical protein